ncbi:MAG: hypothetical protein ACXVLQ_07080 [Bacteriovorax sp.]
MSDAIENKPVGWSETVVMICTKCGEQFSDQKSKEAPERMKGELKAKAKAELGPRVRVITTSCLAICPSNKIAIAKASAKDSAVFKGHSVPAHSTGEELFDKILKD